MKSILSCLYKVVNFTTTCTGTVSDKHFGHSTFVSSEFHAGELIASSWVEFVALSWL